MPETAHGDGPGTPGRPSASDPRAAPATGETRVTYVGQGSVLIEMDGLRILTDPVLKRWVGPLRRYGDLPDPAYAITST